MLGNQHAPAAPRPGTQGGPARAESGSGPRDAEGRGVAQGAGVAP